MNGALVLAVVLAAVAPAAADPCRPTVILDGDAALVQQLGVELAGRGIATAGDCPARTAHVERRGDELVVSIANASRTVREVQTAAAVIESFVREDVGSPLLAIRPLAAEPAAVRRLAIGEPHPLVPPARLPTGWHFFFGIERSVANDGSQWMGAQLGACIMFGPLCAAGRLRGGAIANEPQMHDEPRRKTSEILVGLDVPFRVGRFLVIPGVASGIGGLTTKTAALASSRSNSFRAQAHASFLVPLTASLAIDLYVVGTLAQEVEREPGYMSTLDEPFGFVRFGVAMRYGDR